MDPRLKKTGTPRLLLRGLFGGTSAVFHDRPLGCWRGIGVFVGFIVVLTALWFAGQTALYPWGRAFTPRPMLTGEWIGETTTPSGERMLFYVAMEMPFWGECQGHYNCDFDGFAALCSAQRGLREYTVSGDVRNWRGTKFTFELSKAVDRPYDWRSYDVKGDWDGANTLHVETRLVSDAGRSPGPPDVPLAFTMRRGTKKEFADRCR